MPVRVTHANEVERALSNVYLRLFAEIKKDENYPDNIPALVQRFNKKVYDSTRKAVESVYQEGTNYVGMRLKTESFLTNIDIANIQETTDANVKAFWNRINDDAQRTIEQRDKIVIEPKPSLATAAMLTGISTVIATSSLALGTKSKVQQIASDPEISLDGTDLKGEKPRVRWITQMDERVCPICRELDGQTWAYDDPLVPVAGRMGPNGTHLRCRCFLELY